MESFNDIIASERPTLVDFFATWCGPCKMMHPILEDVKKQLGDEAKVITIDIDKNEVVTNYYRVQSVPTIMIFKNGEIKFRQAGVQTANRLVEEVRKLL